MGSGKDVTTRDTVDDPTLIYRLQLTKEFTFRHALRIIPYLNQLGASHLYISPILSARRGSTHCYDVIDHEIINPELGGLAGLQELFNECEKYGIRLIIDIVPNHMSYSLENPYIIDLIEKWDHSKYYRYFDLKESVWPSNGKIIFPFLSSMTRPSLNKGNVSVHLEKGITVHVDDTWFPASLETYGLISELLSYRKNKAIPISRNRKKVDLINQRERVLKTDYRTLKKTIDLINGNNELIEKLLSVQHADPVGWRDTAERINYRRFFAVNGLIAVRQEDLKVFKRSHAVFRDLSRKGILWGVRIDHIDGLRNPDEYLRNLREYVDPKFVVAEKVLEPKEELPRSLEIDGTTGYDFLGYVNALFVDYRSGERLKEIYDAFARVRESPKDVLHKQKLSFIRYQYSGDLDVLSWEFHKALTSELRFKKDVLRVKDALTYLVSHLNRYRTFSSENDTSEFVKFISKHVKGSGEPASTIEAIKESLESGNLQTISAMLTMQQYTGTAMAKSLEDTLFFLYNRLISLNEVGWVPWKFGIDKKEFFRFILSRQQRYPLSLNETSTHDTKLGEDIRSRISVLSGFPEWWNLALQEIESEILENENFKDLDRRHIYYILQLLEGSIESKNTHSPLRDRMITQITKAMRESGVKTSWEEPSENYENLAMKFLDSILTNLQKSRIPVFGELNKICALYGLADSLSIQLLKFTLPGSPSLYQGSEALNLTFTDPDNRREVDFDRLETLMRGANLDVGLSSFPNFNLDSIKIGLVKFLSHFRASNRDFFSNSNVVPLRSSGKFKDNVIAFSREWNGMRMIVIVTRFLWDVVTGDKEPSMDWEDTALAIDKKMNGPYVGVFSRNRVVINDSIKLEGILKKRHFTILTSNFKKLK